MIIYCPSTSDATDFELECRGESVCKDVTVYSSKDSLVRCRKGTNAGVNVNFYCGTLSPPGKDATDYETSDAYCEMDGNKRKGGTNLFMGCYGT